MMGRRRAIGVLAGAAAMGPGRLFADAPTASPTDGTLLRYGGAPQNLATPTGYFERLITPTSVFFVRSHHGPPLLDRTRKLSVEGLVKNPLTLGVDELRKQFPEVTVTAVLQCAGNGRALMVPRVPGIQWMHGAMGQAAFTGVRLRDVLERAGFDKSGGRHVRVSGADTSAKPSTPDFVRSIPIERALDPTTIIAFKMNGEDLTLAHGAPMRLIVPRWAGDHWVKWLTNVRLQKEEADGFYMQTAYRVPIEPVEPGATVPPEKMRSASTFPIKSTIGFPLDGARVPIGNGKQRVVGIAFSGEAPIAAVEVSIDGGKTWSAAKLEGPSEAGRWQVFRHELEQTPGRMRAIARATDKKGNKQPEKASWNPSGYFWNGWHSVEWEVTA